MFCFFITCNRSADYLTKLLRHIYRPDDLFLIHCDRKSPPVLTSAAARLHDDFENVDLMLPRAYSWAGFSQVEATLDAIKIALRSDQSWTHFATLSEQHLPTMSPMELENLLAGRGSLLQTRPVASMGPGERADVENRSAARYEEMEGVGSFNGGACPVDETFVSGLFHGSNWYFVSRKHCRFLIDLERRGFFERFRYTVHADEHAIQSALSSDEARGIDSIENVETTFIALPHLTDNHDLVFCEQNYWDAQREKVPFVRKRGPELALSIDEFLRTTYEVDIPASACPSQDAAADAALTKRSAQAKRMADKLGKDLLGRFRQFGLNDTHAITQRPLFYVHFQIRAGSCLSLYVLSENLRDYRALIVEQQTFDGFFRPYERFGFEFALLRVRVHGLFFNKEVARLGSRRGQIKLTDANDYAALREGVFEQARDMVALDKLIAQNRPTS